MADEADGLLVKEAESWQLANCECSIGSTGSRHGGKQTTFSASESAVTPEYASASDGTCTKCKNTLKIRVTLMNCEINTGLINAWATIWHRNVCQVCQVTASRWLHDQTLLTPHHPAVILSSIAAVHRSGVVIS